jgi:hypothetical protein
VLVLLPQGSCCALDIGISGGQRRAVARAAIVGARFDARLSDSGSPCGVQRGQPVPCPVPSRYPTQRRPNAVSGLAPQAPDLPWMRWGYPSIRTGFGECGSFVSAIPYPFNCWGVGYRHLFEPIWVPRSDGDRQ